jgi:hypothetical protein
MVPDDMIDSHVAEVEYHASLMEYFSLMAPHLPDRPAFWERVPLFADPVQGKREQMANLFAEYYGVDVKDGFELFDAIEENDAFPDIEAQDEEVVRGLKSLKHWRGRTRTETVERQSLTKGKVTETIERSEHLPLPVAMRVHDLLDEAAAELGFNVRPSKDMRNSTVNEEAEFEVDGVTDK